jgi:hypothetical protein
MLSFIDRLQKRNHSLARTKGFLKLLGDKAE